MDEVHIRRRGRPSFYDVKIARLSANETVDAPEPSGSSSTSIRNTSFSCAFCGKLVRSKHGLESHQRRHTGEKPFACTANGCSKSFRTSSDRTRHLKVHTGVKKHICHVEGCTATFTTSANLLTHNSVVHDQCRNYKCEICGKMFGYLTSYRNHVRIHTGEKQYSCSYPGCRSTFTEYSTALKHALRVHTVNGTFKCPKCTKVYRSSCGLAYHIRVLHERPNHDRLFLDVDRSKPDEGEEVLTRPATSGPFMNGSTLAKGDATSLTLSDDSLRDLILRELPQFANLVRLGGELSGTWCGLEEEREAATLLGFYEDERDGVDPIQSVVETAEITTEFSPPDWSSDIAQGFHGPSLIETFPELLPPEVDM